ncbi:MAG: hypothetical protein L0Y71_10895 [Gemmataceae bacterium]|nr:hypothetical protein [Gemmataceae bacterium]
MPIAIRCTCGRDLTLRDEVAGKVIRCPACAGTLQVPVPAEEVVEEVAAGPPPLPPPRSQSKERDIDDRDLDVEPPPRKPDRPKERKKKKKKSVFSEYYGKEGRDGAVAVEEGWFGSAAAGIGGGVIMLLVGIGILVLGIFFGGIRLIMWAIILIVIAVIALLKGLMDLY